MYLYCPILKCHWTRWSPICNAMLRLDLLEGESCDMAGAIQIAMAIMPNVQRIDVYSGKSRDVVYEQGASRVWCVIPCSFQDIL